LEAEPLREATRWLASYRRYWEESYERLAGLLAALQEETGEAREDEPEETDPTGRRRS
jgi:hypothetical protein